MTDPLEILHTPDRPARPSPRFAAELRGRLIDALTTPPEPPATAKGAAMTTTAVQFRNGHRPGDISYISFGIPDPARGAAFYGALLGWSSTASQSGGGQVDEVTPEVGMVNGRRADGSVTLGAVLGYRVDDVAAVVTRVRDAGGTAIDPGERPYGIESACLDNQGVPFYLHQLLDSPTDEDVDLSNGRRHGDIAYVSLGVPVLALAEAFYGQVLGWTFTPGSHAQGRQIQGVTPMSGLWQTDTPQAVLAFRVDDIRAAMETVAELGGTGSPIEERPYGLAADNCVDDQGTVFHLMQLPV